MALIDVPLTGQNLDQTRNPIRNNFLSVNNAFLVDHVTYNATGAGKHNKVTLPNQATAPTFAPPEVGIYNFVNATSAINELYISKSDGTQVPSTASAQNINGWTYLPSGLLLKWGTSAATRNALSTVTLPTPANAANGPRFTNIFMVQAVQTFSAGPSTGDLNTALCVGNITIDNFQVFARANGLPNSGAINIFYFAIGN
jgi:hypothetical protein